MLIKSFSGRNQVFQSSRKKHDRDINAAVNIKNVALRNLKQLPMEHRFMNVEAGSMDLKARKAKRSTLSMENILRESLKVRLTAI
jgi:transposase